MRHIHEIGGEKNAKELFTHAQIGGEVVYAVTAKCHSVIGEWASTQVSR